MSFVDCPGHDILMATMLNGAAVMDAALLLIGKYTKKLINRYKMMYTVNRVQGGSEFRRKDASSFEKQNTCTCSYLVFVWIDDSQPINLHVV